jgi:hypothetical protein
MPKNIILFVIVAILCMDISFAEIYYVSNSIGNDLNDGLSVERPWKTLQKVSLEATNKTFTSGDSILFLKGDLWISEYLDLRAGMPTTPGPYIVFGVYGIGERPIFDGTPSFPYDPHARIAIRISTPSIKIIGIEIRNYPKDGINADLGTINTLDLIIEAVYVHNNGYTEFDYTYGIVTKGKDVQIRYSIIRNNYNDGIYVEGDNLIIEDSYIESNGTGPVGDQLTIKNSANYLIRGNNFLHLDGQKGIIQAGDNNKMGGRIEYNVLDGNGVANYGITQPGNGTIICYNRFKNISNTETEAFAMKLAGKDNLVYNNLIENCTNAIKIQLDSNIYTDSGEHKIINNTMVNTDLGLEVGKGSTGTIHVLFENNIVQLNSNSNATMVRLYQYASTSTTYVGDKNVFYPTSTSTPKLFKYFELPYDTNLNDWKLHDDQDLNSLDLDPSFSNNNNEPYSLSMESSAIDIGNDFSYIFEDDIIGFPRPSGNAWDIGAYEFQFLQKRPLLDFANVPLEFALEQNFPNPFNPTTTIKYSIAEEGFVNLTVFNLLGEKVATLISKNMKPGRYTVDFDANNLSTGIYVYRLDSGKNTSVKKMILMK